MMGKKHYVVSALIAIAFTLGMSKGEAKARKDHSHGKVVKEKMAKKAAVEKAKQAKKAH